MRLSARTEKTGRLAAMKFCSGDLKLGAGIRKESSASSIYIFIAILRDLLRVVKVKPRHVSTVSGRKPTILVPIISLQSSHLACERVRSFANVCEASLILRQSSLPTSEPTTRSNHLPKDHSPFRDVTKCIKYSRHICLWDAVLQSIQRSW
jgi:hypothetical protein